MNKLLAELGCNGVVDCQPTSVQEVISVAFGFELLKNQVHVDCRTFGAYLTKVEGAGVVSRDAVLYMLVRKVEQLTRA